MDRWNQPNLPRQCGIPEIQYVSITGNGGKDLANPDNEVRVNNIAGSFILEFDGSSVSVDTRDSVNCAYGYEGNMRIIPREEDEDRAGDQVYMTCHYVIKVPSWVEEYSITLIVLGTLFGIGGSIGYYYYRQWLQRVWMRKKAEKRRSRKSSESSVGNIGGGGGRSSSRVVDSRRAKSSGKVKGSRSKSGDKKKKKKKKGKKKKKKKSKG